MESEILIKNSVLLSQFQRQPVEPFDYNIISISFGSDLHQNRNFSAVANGVHFKKLLKRFKRMKKPALSNSIISKSSQDETKLLITTPSRYYQSLNKQLMYVPINKQQTTQQVLGAIQKIQPFERKESSIRWQIKSRKKIFIFERKN